MLTILLAGFGLCFSLIAAPGAQNVFLLREGIRRAGEGKRAVLTLAAVCLASDVVLISAGVAGFGAAIDAVPWLFQAARWAGVVFLVGYGLFAGWRALRGTGEAIDVSGTADVQSTARPASSAPARSAATSVDPAADPAHPEPGRPAAPTSSAPAPSGSTSTATLTRPTLAARRAILPAVLTCLAITWLNPHTYLDTVLLLGSVSTSYGDARWMFAIGAIAGSAAWFAFLTVAARFAARWLRSPRSWRVLDGAVAVMMLGLAGALAV